MTATAKANADLTDLAEQIWSLHLEAPLEVAEPERADVLATAFEYGATVYDAVYVALSRSLDLPLLTAERTTTPWVVKLGPSANASPIRISTTATSGSSLSSVVAT